MLAESFSKSWNYLSQRASTKKQTLAKNSLLEKDSLRAEDIARAEEEACSQKKIEILKMVQKLILR